MQKKSHLSKRKKNLSPAFTLIELLVVCTIIAILTVVAVVNYNSSKAKTRDSRRIADISSIQSALELYYDSNNTYPYTRTSGGTCGIASSSTRELWCNSTASYSQGQWIRHNGTPALVDYLPVMPVDPKPVANSIEYGTYWYVSSATDDTAKIAKSYFVYFGLEQDNKILQKDGAFMDTSGFDNASCCANGYKKIDYNNSNPGTYTNVVVLGNNHGSNQACGTQVTTVCPD